jgi:hypothetical protein
MGSREQLFLWGFLLLSADCRESRKSATQLKSKKQLNPRAQIAEVSIGGSDSLDDLNRDLSQRSFSKQEN